MFKLKVIQAKYGDCLIVQFGTEDNPKHMLIDGGPGGVYPNYLRPELKKINDAGGKLDYVVLSHVDADHIVGLLNLTEELKEQQADELPPVIKIKEFWMNSFTNTVGRDANVTQAVQSLLSKVNNINSVMPEGELALLSIKQGDTLRRNTLLLDIPLNGISETGIISNNTVAEAFNLNNLKITIIGPTEENLNELESEWKEWIKKNEAKILMSDPEVLAFVDKSVPNLSSIMFLMEAEGKTILFTGDGRGDFILDGLEKKNLLDEDGNIHVDVFKVPHHGSIRNASEDFFLRVKADKYIISGDGHHDNPDFDTLKFIVDAAIDQKRKIELICTNRTEFTQKLEKEVPSSENPYKIIYLEKDKTSLEIDML